MKNNKKNRIPSDILGSSIIAVSSYTLFQVSPLSILSLKLVNRDNSKKNNILYSVIPIISFAIPVSGIIGGYNIINNNNNNNNDDDDGSILLIE